MRARSTQVLPYRHFMATAYLRVSLLMGISIPHTLDDLPIWQRLASTGKWDAAQKENSGRAAGSPICDVTEVTEKRKEES